MLSKKLVLLVCMVFIASASFAQTYKYIGAKKCGMCHNKPATGAQLKKWSSLKHAKSMKALSTDAAKGYAKKAGIADAKTAKECLTCHSTAGGVDKKLHAGITVAEGVYQNKG